MAGCNDLSGIRIDQARYASKKCRLPRTARSKQGHELSGLGREREPFEDAALAEPLAEIADMKAIRSDHIRRLRTGGAHLVNGRNHHKNDEQDRKDPRKIQQIDAAL
jgi:hypothetical protein